VSRPSVVIFRKRLLSYSETFIADQGQLLPNYRPVYCGFQQDSSGIRLIENADKIILDDFSHLLPLSKLLFRKGFNGSKAWIDAIGHFSPALIHAHFFNDGLDAIKLGRKLKIPTATTLHGHDITKHENAAVQSSTNQDFFAQVDCVIAVSDFIAQHALAKGCPEPKLVQHYIGIDLEKFVQAKKESALPSLLFVGRLVEKKGCTYLLQAMQRLQPRFPGLKLTIVGEGSLMSSLQQEAKSRQLQVEFAGTETPAQIRQRLASSWLFVAPSITADDGDAEGLGMVFLEAQALQTPVVSFRSGGIVEAVADESTGLLCEEKDVAGLAHNIASLLESSCLRHTMGIEGRKRVEAEFDVRKQCAKLEQIYAKLR